MACNVLRYLTMTKRHFEALARTMRDLINSCGPGTKRDAFAEAAEAIADVCQAENPRFDRDRFLEACDALSR